MNTLVCNGCGASKRPLGWFKKEGREEQAAAEKGREEGGTLIKCDLAARRIASCAPHRACDGVMKEKRQTT